MNAELWFLEHRPERYADVARLVDIAMRHGAKPCIGDGCDLDAPCKRHDRTTSLVWRHSRRYP